MVLGMMKIDRLETHDRYKAFTKQSTDISECCQDLINQRPFGEHPFYIFAHARTHEDGFSKRILWQPRLTRPKAQTNAMLFKAYPGTDVIKVCWIIPPREMWSNYEKGKICHSEMIAKVIHDFEYNRVELDRPFDDDYSDEKIDMIYKELSQQAKTKKMISKIYRI